jgi:hypothetical protein
MKILCCGPLFKTEHGLQLFGFIEIHSSLLCDKRLQCQALIAANTRNIYHAYTAVKTVSLNEMGHPIDPVLLSEVAILLLRLQRYRIYRSGLNR